MLHFSSCWVHLIYSFFGPATLLVDVDVVVIEIANVVAVAVEMVAVAEALGLIEEPMGLLYKNVHSNSPQELQ